MKNKVIKLSPELSDGEHYLIVSNRAELIDSINNWMDNFDYMSEGESFTVEIVEMTTKELNELADI